MNTSLEGPLLEVGIALVCVALGASLSATSTALTSLGEVRLRAIRDSGGPLAPTAGRALGDLENILARLLLARVMCLSFASALAARVAFTLEGVGASFAAAGLVALLYAIVAETTTRFAVARATRWAPALLRIFRPLELLIIPIAVPVAAFGNLVDRLFPARPDPSETRLVEVAMEEVIERGEETGSIPQEQADLMRSVLEFKDTLVQDVMVPRTQMVAMDITTPLDEVLTRIVEEGHSRYAVYRERIDVIQGVLYAKDLFRVLRDPSLKDTADLASIIRKPVFFVATTQKIGSLLKGMQSRRVHLAVVIDEFGGTAGIVTLEDVLEEIVGDIQDEHDDEVSPIETIGEGRYLADAGVSVYDLEDFLGASLAGEEARSASLGGLVVTLAGRVPTAGESVTAGGFELVVRESDERRVARVEIRRLPENQGDHSEAAAE